MRLQNSQTFPFTHISPIYNWIYPLSVSGKTVHYDGRRIEDIVTPDPLAGNTRAIYLHVPFCQTICSFCPLLKGPLGTEEALNTYVEALLSEIRWKGGDRELTRLPIRAIFFGGGTPSLLRPQHISAIGEALRDAFNLDALEEFSVEMEVKSICAGTLEAFQQIGVTHARFGLQTFSQHHRDALNLTASIDQLHNAAATLPIYFPHVSCDILYGLPGQTSKEFFQDISSAIDLGLNNLDFYPLNTVVAQRRMHRDYDRQKLRPLSEAAKLYMGRALRAIMNENSFFPHNGHGYVKLQHPSLTDKNMVVTDAYSFKYHEYVYGTLRDEYIGIGNGAQSYVAGNTIENISSRDQYVTDLLKNKKHSIRVKRHSNHVNAAKALAITLPYFGSVKQEMVDWGNIPEYVVLRLEELSRLGLISIGSSEIALTREGWHWYTNIMYYLCPDEERSVLHQLIFRADDRRLHSVDMDTLTLAR